MDLFQVIEKNKDKLHNNYKAITSKGFEDCKDAINNWAEGFVDRDNKFINEFQTTFNSSFWELYCFAVLRQMGYKVNFNYETPDFIIEKENKNNIIIECTVANHSKDGISEDDIYEKINPSMTLEESVDSSTIRLANSLYSKSNLYINKYRKLNYVKNKPFIIALAPFDQPNFQNPSMQPIRRVLFGYDLFEMDSDYYELDFEQISKKNGSEVKLGVFTNDKFEHISGVLFSCVATSSKAQAYGNTKNRVFRQTRYNSSSKKSKLCINYTFTENSKKDMLKIAKKEEKLWKEHVHMNNLYNRYYFEKPLIKEGYSESLTDGLHLFINPFAQNKISKDDIDKFYFNGVNIYSYDIEKGIEINEKVHDNFLLQRSVTGIRFKR